MRKQLGLILVTSLFTAGALAQSTEGILAILGHPDSIFYNAKIVTVDNESFSSNIGTIAQAMAIRDKKILATGSNGEIRALAGPATQMIDLRGRTVVPGFIMVHNHPQDWFPVVPEIMNKVIPEELMINRFLTGPPREQMERFPQVLEEAVKVAKPGAWIVIVLIWDITVSPDDPYLTFAGTRITKAQLDQAAPNNPVMVRSREAVLRQGRETLINQKAIDVIRKEADPERLANMNNLDPIERTGIAGSIYRMAIPEVILKNRLDLWMEAFRLDLTWWAGMGQTTFGGFLYHYPNVLLGIRKLDRQGELPNRVAWGWGALPRTVLERAYQDPFLVADLATREGRGTDYMWYYGTGSVGGGSCVTDMLPLVTRPTGPRLIMEPCENRDHLSQARGSPGWKAMYQLVKAGGRLMGYHTWGDPSVDVVLELIEEASREGGLSKEEIRARRHTVDHLQGFPRENQVGRIKDLGLILGGSNFYIHQDGPRWLRDYGERGLDRLVPRKTLVEAGIMSGIEIDKPIELSETNAFTALSWSITRKAQDGKAYAQQTQGISREAALKTATIWGAYYVLKEDVLGSLESGKFADFLVLDRDYLTVPEDQIENVRILMASVGGKAVHLVPSLARELGMQPTGAQVELGGPAANY